MKAQWQQEKETLGAVGKIKQQIEQARIEAEQATRAGDLGKAAEITYGTIPQLEREMKEAGGEARERTTAGRSSSRRRSTRRTSPRSSRGGRAFPSRG